MTTPPSASKVVVFDMDETLGYFVEFSIFWEALLSYIKEYNKEYHLKQDDFNKILELYPEFIRPNITTLLNYLKQKKISKECDKIMIYTNNQGPKQWTLYIKEYFENKIDYPLFDQVILAFKVNGKHVELGRTTHDKTFKDLIKCTKLPVDTQICFMDDTYYPDMKHDNVYYIKIKPYTYDLSFDLLIERFSSSNIGKKIMDDDTHFAVFMKHFIQQYKYIYEEKSPEELEIDKIVTKKTMIHLQQFFSKNNAQFYSNIPSYLNIPSISSLFVRRKQSKFKNTHKSKKHVHKPTKHKKTLRRQS
jgi:hypothetical protein